jgi:hypothetical protein
MSMTDIEKLVEIESIKKLKARYYRFMDTGQYDQLENIFSEDAVFDERLALKNMGDASTGEKDFFEKNIYVTGRAAIVNMFRTVGGSMRGVHHGHMPEIEILSATTASGIWAMEDIVSWPSGGPVKHLHGYGYYHDTYTKVNGSWKVQSHQLLRLWVDWEPGSV